MGARRIATAAAVVGIGALTAVGCTASQMDDERIYRDPNGPAVRALDTVLPTTPNSDVRATAHIADHPSAIWLTDTDHSQRARVESVVYDAARVDALPVFVVYGIPLRDCEHYSSGGAVSNDSYLDWVSDIASGFGNHRAWVVLEPDAVAHVVDGCAPRERLEVLHAAVRTLVAAKNVRVYVDAGNAYWAAPDEMRKALISAGVNDADGIALNVANYASTGQTVSYARKVTEGLDVSGVVIDTSRNGAPTDRTETEAWCNSPEARLGAAPTLDTGLQGVDAFLWVKQPGNSDGPCGENEPDAGVWSFSLAGGLVAPIIQSDH